MNFVRKCTSNARQLLILFLFAGITACGGGGGSSASPPVGSSPPPPPAPPPQDPGEEIIDNEVTGSVGDGPVVNAQLKFYNRHNTLLKSNTSDETAGYNVTIREKGKNYPVRFFASQGTDLVTFSEPDFEMVSAIMKASRKSHGNLNPHSTLMIKIAEHLGDLNDVNYVKSRGTVLSSLNFGLDTQRVADPVDTVVDDITAPILVKSSETMGEMVRRTRDALISTGVTSGDAVIKALAADLVDGVLDGRGANGTNARVSAVATLTSAQVLTEALVNDLHVGGTSATSRMDDAIKTIRPNATSSVNTENVLIPAQMLAQTTLAVDAAWTLTEDPALDDLRGALRSVPSGTKPAQIRGTLPDAKAALSDAVETATFGTSTDLEKVNSTIRNGEAPGPAPDPEIGFAVTSHQVSEGSQLLVLVERANTLESAWVDYEYVDGSAIGGSDYSASAGRLQFAIGEASKYITVASLQDSAYEGDESFELHLVAVSGNSYLNMQTISTITITDDDSASTPPAYSAPTLLSATVNGDFVDLQWSHPDHPPDGGYDIWIDGQDTGAEWRTTSLSASVGPLDNTVRHCFQIEARYAGVSNHRSNELCTEAAPPVGDTGTALLSWTPPTQREDGSALNDLSGYRVYYGLNQNQLDQTVVLNNAGLTSYMVESLGQGTWYFAVTAVDGGGMESGFSNVASKVIM